MEYMNYVCFFSNGTFKIGVTKSPHMRLANYVREASRFGRRVTGFWVSCKRDKKIAMTFESSAKRFYADCAIEKHSETFDGAKVKGDVVVNFLGLSASEKKHQNFLVRKMYSLCGKYQASTASQRAAIIVMLCYP